MAGIRHNFVSADADGTDNTLVKPSDWNAGHVLIAPQPFGVVTARAGAEVLIDERISTVDTKRDFLHRKAVVSPSATSWTTILTITPSVINFFMMGLIKILMTGHTSTLANGSRSGYRTVDVSNAAPTSAVVGTDITAGSVPSFQVVPSGNALLVQIQSANGTAPFWGLIDIELLLPAGVSGGGPTVDWVIT